MSQYALANASDLDRTYISLLERGYRSPTLDTMLSLARALDVSLGEIGEAIEAHLSMNK
jgi:transcriptional regulator with XRE-family HTH domain